MAGQALRKTLSTFPELRHQTFHVQGMPMSFGYLMVNSEQGRQVLLEMMQPNKRKQELKFKESYWPSDIQALAPKSFFSDKVESENAVLPSLSTNSLTSQLKPFWQGDRHPSSPPIKVLEMEMRQLGIESMGEAYPNLSGIQLPSTTKEKYLESVQSAHHEGFQEEDQKKLRSLFPLVSLSSMVDYSRKVEKDNWQEMAAFKEQQNRISALSNQLEKKEDVSFVGNPSERLIDLANEIARMAQTDLDNQRTADLKNPYTPVVSKTDPQKCEEIEKNLHYFGEKMQEQVHQEANNKLNDKQDNRLQRSHGSGF